MFLLVPAYPGGPGQKAVKRLCVCVAWRCKLALRRDLFSPLFHAWSVFCPLDKLVSPAKPTDAVGDADSMVPKEPSVRMPRRKTPSEYAQTSARLIFSTSIVSVSSDAASGRQYCGNLFLGA